jgi:hypothetical protein
VDVPVLRARLLGGEIGHGCLGRVLFCWSGRSGTPEVAARRAQRRRQPDLPVVRVVQNRRILTPFSRRTNPQASSLK